MKKNVNNAMPEALLINGTPLDSYKLYSTKCAMKKAITSKIEALLNAMYGEPLPEKNLAATKTSGEGKKESEHIRCKALPFEFIRLLL